MYDSGIKKTKKKKKKKLTNQVNFQNKKIWK